MECTGKDARIRFIQDMERIIAGHCYTTTHTTGCHRLPVHYVKNGEKYYADREYQVANVALNEVPTMEYRFAAHRMNIGEALLEIMDYLTEKTDDPNLFDYYSNEFDDE